MDSQKRDESRDRRREEALARRVGEALDRIAPRDAGECPDAELLAAYHERALQPGEIAQCESHFAICSRCRKILAVLAASADVPLAEREVAHLGELIAAARAPLEAPARTAEPTRPNRLAWRMRWLTPALGLAAVLAVWFAMRPPWRTANQDSSGTLIAQAPKTEPPPNTETRALEQFSKVTPKKTPETDAVAPRDRSFARAQSSNPAADALAKNRLDDGRALDRLTPSAGVAESASGNEKKDKAELNSAVAGAPPPAPPPLAGPFPRPLSQAQPQVVGQAASATEVPGSKTQSVMVAGEVPVAETTGGTVGNASARDKQALAGPRRVSDLPVNGRNFQSLSNLDAAGETAVQIKTPSGKVFWRVGKSGRIQRSTDAGRAWILQTSPLQEEWLAGAAVSDTICWIVGRNGAIARTIDAEHWEKIAPPSLSAATSGKLPDWINVAVSGAQTATIVANDQRRYATQDGGKTWRAQ
jgi:hypothetical protein